TSRFGHTSKRFCRPVVSITLFNKTSIHDGTPARLVTFSVMVSFTIVCILVSQSPMSETSLLGVLLYSAQKGILSINIAERSPKTVPFSWYSCLLPPNRKLFPKNKCALGLLLRYIHNKSLLAA